MTKKEAINNLNMISVAFVDPVTKEQRKLIDDTIDMAIKALEQEPCEDEYIKVPKKALKYRTAGMVAYNAEWLKNHFDIERAVICGAQQPCEDAISRQAVLDGALYTETEEGWSGMTVDVKYIEALPPVKPQYTDDEIQKMQDLEQAEIQKAYELGKAEIGQWIPVSERLPEEREWYLAIFKEKDTGYQLIPRVADYIGKGENKWRVIDEEGLCQEYRDILECVAWMPLPKPHSVDEPLDERVDE